MVAHDGNYLALSGLLSKFTAKPNEMPVYPGNIVADYAAGSLTSFTMIMQALVSKTKHAIVDSGMVQNSMYFGQAELLKAAEQEYAPYEKAYPLVEEGQCSAGLYKDR
jgi:crotonobetainyl-CoA:carnitine CoA-transferase CaiB-like acyl-CoA transferase